MKAPVPEPANQPDFQTPVLFLIFNRPDATAQVLVQLRRAGVRWRNEAVAPQNQGHGQPEATGDPVSVV